MGVTSMRTAEWSAIGILALQVVVVLLTTIPGLVAAAEQRDERDARRRARRRWVICIIATGAVTSIILLFWQFAEQQIKEQSIQTEERHRHLETLKAIGRTAVPFDSSHISADVEFSVTGSVINSYIERLQKAGYFDRANRPNFSLNDAGAPRADDSAECLLHALVRYSGVHLAFHRQHQGRTSRFCENADAIVVVGTISGMEDPSGRVQITVYPERDHLKVHLRGPVRIFASPFDGFGIGDLPGARWEGVFSAPYFGGLDDRRVRITSLQLLVNGRHLRLPLTDTWEVREDQSDPPQCFAGGDIPSDWPARAGE